MRGAINALIHIVKKSLAFIVIPTLAVLDVGRHHPFEFSQWQPEFSGQNGSIFGLIGDFLPFGGYVAHQTAPSTRFRPIAREREKLNLQAAHDSLALAEQIYRWTLLDIL